jgi:hypothetical protein
MAAYAYADSSAELSLTPHPTQGGWFVDDSMPPLTDPIAAYGALGFGILGDAPCPGSGTPDAPPEGGGDDLPAEPDGLVWVEVEGAQQELLGEPWPLTYVQLAGATDTTCIRLAEELSGDHGFRILSVLAPDGVFCLAPEEALEEMNLDPRVELATNQAIPGLPPRSASPRDPIDTRYIWNLGLTMEEETLRVELPPLHDCIPEDGWRWEFPEPDPERQTSTFMIGWVGVQLVLPESMDDRECSHEDNVFTENWTTTQIDRIVTCVRMSLEAAFSEPDPARDLKFIIPQPELVEIPYEPITIPIGDTAWQECLYDSLGFAGIDWPTRGFAYNNALRAQYKTDWFVHTFVVNDACDLDMQFPDGWSAYSSYYGPRDVIDYMNHLLPYSGTVAHEFAHLFGAPDEYDGPGACDSSADCSQLWGYLRSPNANCERCPNPVACLMEGTADHEHGHSPLCQWTLAHLGWRDSDGDGVFDPLDHPDSGLRMVLQDTTGVLGPGDRIVIQRVNDLGLRFMKTIPLTDTNFDQGLFVWDGIKYDGTQASTSAPYVWSCGEEVISGELVDDAISPALGNVHVVPMDSRLHLRFDFADEDTHGGRVRVTTRPAGSGSTWSTLIHDKFWKEAPPEAPIDTSFSVRSGLYDMKFLLWDVGGGHNAERELQFLAGPSAEVREQPDRLTLNRTGPHPNPAARSIRWSIDGAGRGPLRAKVLRADGRCIRSWPVSLDDKDSGEVTWDRTDQAGRRVPAGRYFLVLENEAGRRFSAPIVIIE